MTNQLSPDYLFLELGLYQSIEMTDDHSSKFESFLKNPSEIQFDCYCIECQKDSTFKHYLIRGNQQTYSIHNHPPNALDRIQSHEPFNFLLECQRNKSHISSFSFLIRNEKLTKIGQFPSAADIQLHKIKRYRKVLSNDYRDFSKAIGLYSHGIGIGSFAYLRRIFENLIDENRLKAAKDPKWDNTIFEQSRMDEKIKLLKEYLPSILVENRNLYSILSKGIHELTEKECLNLFPKVKLAIELILDEKLHLMETEEKVKSVKDFVSATIGKFKS